LGEVDMDGVYVNPVEKIIGDGLLPKLTNFQAGRFLLKMSNTNSLNIGITGHTQRGKSTYACWLASEIHRCKHNMFPKKWAEDWFFEELCARNFNQFVDLVDKNDNAVIMIEEAGFELGNMDWNTVISRVFSKIIQTQAYSLLS